MTTRKVVLNVGHLTGSTPPAEAVVEGTVRFEASTELGIDGKLIPIKAFEKPIGETIDLYILGPGQGYNVTVSTSGGYGSARFAIAPEAGPEIALCDVEQVDQRSFAKVPADPDWVIRLDREKQDRWDADQDLQEAIDGLGSSKQDVATLDGDTAAKVDDQDSALRAAINTLISGLNLATAQALSQAINTEVTARNGAISTAIGTEVTNRNTAITTAINNLVASAPGALDTLKELADALGDDPQFATTVTNALATKLTMTDVGQLKVWAKNPDMLVAGSITYSSGLLSTAVVEWPDGKPGVLTIDSRQSGTDAVTAYHVTHVDGSTTKTFTQPTITRDSSGAATNVPQITVA